MVLSLGNGRRGVPWELLDVPLILEVADVSEVNRDLVVIAWLSEPKTAKVNRCGYSSLSQTQSTEEQIEGGDLLTTP